jgi:hypothetical protein
MEIRQIDALVHPDFAGALSSRRHDVREERMRPLWNRRIDELTKQPDALLLYYSAYLDNLQGDSLPSWELERRQKCQSQLGDRFYFFGFWELPTRELLWEFNDRGFKFDPNLVRLVAYGEYYHECVATWLAATQEALQLPNSACSRNPSLSIGVDVPDLHIYLLHKQRESLSSTIHLVNNKNSYSERRFHRSLSEYNPLTKG